MQVMGVRPVLYNTPALPSALTPAITGSAPALHAVRTAPGLPASGRRNAEGSNLGAAAGRQPPPAPAASAAYAGPKAVGLTRAKRWSAEVEDVFRLQEAGYISELELLALGQPAPDRWASSGFIWKLRVKHSLEGPPSFVYFKQAAECEPRYLNRVKLYRYD